MALTRKLLEGMGLEEKQVETIIEAHVDVVNALKSERDKAREDADKVPELQKQLEEAVKAAETDDDWKAKYDDEHTAYEAYKAEVEAGRKEAEKAEKYRKVLGEAGIDPRRIDSIMRVTDLTAVEVDEEGNIKDADAVKEKVAEEWSDFVLKSKTEGSDPATPPKNEGGTPGADPDVRAKLQERHERLYGKATEEKE